MKTCVFMFNLFNWIDALSNYVHIKNAEVMLRQSVILATLILGKPIGGKVVRLSVLNVHYL